MFVWALLYTKQARKDAKKLTQSGLRDRAESLLDILATDPLASPPSYEKLVGNLHGAYSRRINFQHRLVYQVLFEEQQVKILRMWSRYE